MAGRIPIYRRVGDVLRMRPGKADRSICASCHRMPSRASLLPPRSALHGPTSRGGTAFLVASPRVPGRQYRCGQAPEGWKVPCHAVDPAVATGGTIASRSTAAGRQAQATGAELLSRSTIPRGTDVRVADLGPAELPKVDVVPLTRPELRAGIEADARRMVLATFGAGNANQGIAAGAVFGADLNPWQGRILLTVALTLPDPLAAPRVWLEADTTKEVRA